MKNINWSKWIAIVLSVFILTQFVQVSFLAARQVGNGQADAGVDASKGSLAEEIYQGVWDAVGDSDSMILSASADENAPVEDPDADPEIDESATVGSPDGGDEGAPGAAGAGAANTGDTGSGEGGDEGAPVAGEGSSAEGTVPGTAPTGASGEGEEGEAVAGATVAGVAKSIEPGTNPESGDAATGASGAVTLNTPAAGADATTEAGAGGTGVPDAEPGNTGNFQILGDVTPTTTLTNVDSGAYTSGDIDLTGKGYSETTVFTFGLSLSDGDLTGISDSTIVTFSDHFSVPDQTTATDVTGDLYGSVTYTISDNAIKITGLRSIDAAKTGTITVSGVGFDNTKLPATADTTTGTGSITIGSGNISVLLPAKDATASTVTATLSKVDDANYTSGNVDLVSKTATGTTSFTISLNATAGSLAGVSEQTVATFSDHFNVPDVTIATAVSGGLSSSLSYTITNGVVKVTGNGTIDASKTGTIFIDDVGFDNTKLPDTADTTTGTGTIEVGSATVYVLLPAKDATASTVTATLSKVDDANYTSGNVDLVSKTATGTTSFTISLNATAGSLAGVSEQTVATFSNHFEVANVAATTVTGDLKTNLSYTVTDGVVKVSGTGAITAAKTGTITISNVGFSSENLPDTADTTTGTGLLTVGSTATPVLLPAKPQSAATPVISLKYGGAVYADGTTINLTDKTANDALSFEVQVSSNKGVLTAGSKTVVFPDCFSLTDAVMSTGKITAIGNAVGALTANNNTVTITYETGTVAADNTTGSFTITGVKLVNDRLPATAGVYTGKIAADAAQISVNLPAKTFTGSIYLTRNEDSKTLKKQNEPANLAGYSYMICNASRKDITSTITNKSVTATTADNSVYFKDLPAGTYYVAEVDDDYSLHTPPVNGAIAATATGAGSELATDGAGYWGPIVIGETAGSYQEAYVTLSGYHEYTLSYLGTDGKAITGKKYTISADKGHFWDETQTAYKWTTAKTPVSYAGVFVNKGEYSVTVEDFNGDEVDVTFAIDENGILTVDKVGSDALSADVENNNALVIRQVDPSATKMLIQLVDADDGNSKVAGKGAAFELHQKTGTKLKKTDIAVTVSSTGLVSAPITKDGEYYLVEVTPPNGYVTQIDDEWKESDYLISVTGGVVTYPNKTPWVKAKGGGMLSYERLTGMFVINRTDLMTATTIPETVEYSVYPDKDCKEEAVGKITLKKGTDKYTGKLEGLKWDTDYYLRETSAATTGYTRDPYIYGPYKFSPTMSYSTKVAKSTVEDMTITLTLPGEEEEDDGELGLDFKLVGTIGTTTVTSVAPAGTVKVSGKFTGSSSSSSTSSTGSTSSSSSSTEKTVTLTNGLFEITGLVAGETYTITYTGGTEVPVCIPATFTVKVNSAGTMAEISTTTTGCTVGKQSIVEADEACQLGIPFSKYSIKMEVCTAEQGTTYSSYVTSNEEVEFISGFGFDITTGGTAAASTPITSCLDSTGKLVTTNKFETDDKGEIHLYGLPDTDTTKGERYIFAKSNVTADNLASSGNALYNKARKVDADTASYFRATLTSGKVAEFGKVSASSSGSWKTASGNIRAYLKQGTIKVKANNTNKTYYIYRLFDGSSGSTNDERGDKKLLGNADDYRGSDSNFVIVANALNVLSAGPRAVYDLFVLTAHAASATTMTYANNTWQLIGSQKAGSSSETLSFTGLIEGQPYLVREGTSTTPSSSDKYFLVKSLNGSDTKTISGTASSSASTSNSGRSVTGNSASSKASTKTTATNTTNNTGRSISGNSAGSSNAGARGTQTGDDNRLWLHLIIMLIAFDALVADLLYISRKKQPARRRR